MLDFLPEGVSSSFSVTLLGEVTSADEGLNNLWAISAESPSLVIFSLSRLSDDLL